MDVFRELLIQIRSIDDYVLGEKKKIAMDCWKRMAKYKRLKDRVETAKASLQRIKVK